MRDAGGVGSGVGLIVDLLHAIGRQVRVDLGRGEGLMPQQLLHAPQVRASIQQMWATGFSQSGRMWFAFQPARISS